MRKRTSPIWDIPANELSKIVKESISFVEILRKCHIDYVGSSIKTLKKKLDYENIDYSEVQNNKLKYNYDKKRKIELKDVLVKNSTYSRNHLKRRLLEEEMLENKCQECGLLNSWNGSPITLQLDHINGVRNDNRLENLRLLCPNCHSQTSTFAGRGLKKKNTLKRISDTEPDWRNRDRPSKRKVDRPSKEELQHLIKTCPMTKIGKMFGVSDNAVRKWARRYGIFPGSSSG